MATNKDEWGNIQLPGLSDEELYRKDWQKSAIVKEIWSRQSHVEKRKKSHTAAMSNPETRQKLQQVNRRNQTVLNGPEAQRKKKQTKIQKGLYHDENYYEEIYLQFWNNKRNDKKFRNDICKKYDISKGTLHSLINNGFGINLPQHIKDTHDQRLIDWRQKYGDMQYQYIIITPDQKKFVFDTLSDAGRWFCQRTNIQVKVRDGKLNYGNVLYRQFEKLNFTVKKGRHIGYTFIKQAR